MIKQVEVQFGDVLSFLQHDDLGPATTTAKFITHVTELQKKDQLEVELAAVLRKSVVTATYVLNNKNLDRVSSTS